MQYESCILSRIVKSKAFEFAQKLLTILSLLCILLTLSNCQSSLQKSSLQSKIITPNNHIVFVVSLGFYSCTHRMTDLQERVNLWLDAEKHETSTDSKSALMNSPQPPKISVFETCFTGGILEGSTSEVLYYRLYELKGRKLVIKSKDPQSATVTSISNIIRGYSENRDSQETKTYVYFLGHSHGGGLTMKTLLDWTSLDDRNAAKSIEIRNFYTIDPISFEHCSQSHMALFRAVYGVIPTPLTKDPECTSAPQDLAADGGTIKSRISGLWINYFQDDFEFLHSSPIKDADSNRDISFEEDGVLNFAHKGILWDKRVWISINATLSQDLAKVLRH